MGDSEKVSITLDRELLAEARRYGGGNLSGWIGAAVHDRVLLERAREFLADEETELGPIPQELRDEVRRKWASR